MNELPLRCFYDEPRQIIISGHQKGLGWGMMFGVVGVLVADSTNKASAGKRFGESAHAASTDIGTLAREVLEEEIAAGRAPGWSLSKAEPVRGGVEAGDWLCFRLSDSLFHS